MPTLLDTTQILSVALTPNLDRIRQCLIDKPHKPRKIQCRNSYERMVVHHIAQALGISHQTQIRYDEIFINDRYVYHDSHCCRSCDSHEHHFHAVPRSWVFLGYKNRVEPQIGVPHCIPKGRADGWYDKEALRNSHAALVDHHRRVDSLIQARHRTKQSLFTKLDPRHAHFADVEIATQ